MYEGTVHIFGTICGVGFVEYKVKKTFDAPIHGDKRQKMNEPLTHLFFVTKK